MFKEGYAPAYSSGTQVGDCGCFQSAWNDYVNTSVRIYWRAKDRAPMATKKKRATRITSRVATQERPVALTLKIDRTMYRRLIGLRAAGEKLRTHQDILRQALKEYLDRVGA